MLHLRYGIGDQLEPELAKRSAKNFEAKID
jgi:hypothetical protein